MRKIIMVMVFAVAVAFAGTSMAAADGAKVFASKCATCHGKDAGGTKGMAPSLKASKFVHTASDADVKATILNGRAGAKKQYKDISINMPDNKTHNLSDDEVTAVVKYLKSLKP